LAEQSNGNSQHCGKQITMSSPQMTPPDGIMPHPGQVRKSNESKRLTRKTSRCRNRSILSRLGYRTGTGNTWTALIVRIINADDQATDNLPSFPICRRVLWRLCTRRDSASALEELLDRSIFLRAE
jgi:hypothetical protein